MGTFEVPIHVGDMAGQRFVAINALAGTRAAYLTVPASILSGLGIPEMERRRFELPDGQTAEYGVGQARVRLDGQEWSVVVVFAPEGSQPRLGMTTLGVFNLAVDPSSQRLVPTLPLLKIPLRKAG